MSKQKIGFIGQGWIGKNYSDVFEERGYVVVRYSLEEPYINNKENLKDCRIVFVAVPTPTTPEGFDDSILIKAIRDNTIKDQIIVIKSTLKIGTTDRIQKMFSDRYIIHSPEFLTEKTAKYDAANPDRNILGYTEKSKSVTGEVMLVLPCAPYNAEVPCRDAEFVKYMGNCWFYFKVLAMNIFYDIAEANNLDIDKLAEMLGADKRVGKTHLKVVHQGGRGAGGHCFIKDFEALIEMYMDMLGEPIDVINFADKFLKSARNYNKKLLTDSGKDLDLLEGIYGKQNEVVSGLDVGKDHSTYSNIKLEP